MTALTVTQITKTGSDILGSGNGLQAASDGDTVVFKSGLLIVARNNHTSAATLTISPNSATTNTSQYGSVDVDDLTYALDQDEQIMFTLPAGFSTNNVVTFELDEDTDFEIGIFSIG